MRDEGEPYEKGGINRACPVAVTQTFDTLSLKVFDPWELAICMTRGLKHPLFMLLR